MGSNVETYFSENSLESKRVILKKPPSNGDMDPKVAIFYNKAKLLAVGMVHQPSHKTFYLKSVLPAKCAQTRVAQNL